MATNWIQPGDVITVPAPATIAAGAVTVIGSLVGVAANSAATGEPLDIETNGVWTLPKVSALAIAIGDTLYFDSATKLVNKTASGNTKIGYATAVSPNPSATVKVRLVPTI